MVFHNVGSVRQTLESPSITNSEGRVNEEKEVVENEAKMEEYASSPNTNNKGRMKMEKKNSVNIDRKSHPSVHVEKKEINETEDEQDSRLTELHEKRREYRVGLYFFNEKPQRGIRYFIQRGFLKAAPQAVARFLLTRKNLSKQMIGEYLGNLQESFNMDVLKCFVQYFDFAGMQVDVALRKFQTFFRMPGKAQQIYRLVEVFSKHYIDCNPDIASKFHNPNTLFVLAFAIVMLNTDLHTPNMKAERRMKQEEFIQNLRSIDDNHDIDRDTLIGIYERIKANELETGSDHVTPVLKIQQAIVGEKNKHPKLNLALPHRRLECDRCLYEVYDVSKKEETAPRVVFIFNDLLLVTKSFINKKNNVNYTFRQSFPLCGMDVTQFETPYYPYGIRLSQRADDKELITFNAKSDFDRWIFLGYLKECILEMDLLEKVSIECELEKQKMVRVRGTEERDSDVADMEIIPQTSKDGTLSPESAAAAASNLERSVLPNSLLDLHEQLRQKEVKSRRKRFHRIRNFFKSKDSNRLEFLNSEVILTAYRQIEDFTEN